MESKTIAIWHPRNVGYAVSIGRVIKIINYIVHLIPKKIQYFLG